MHDSISRRDFLKTSSAIGLSATALNPVSSLAEPRQKVRVVIAKDDKCMNGNTPDPAKLQDLVDHAIMTLTGKNQIGAAYEALFPQAVTAGTKILLKRNDISGTGSINAAAVNALKQGLTKMLNGTFSASNITVRCSGGSAKGDIDKCTYLINCPVCWMHGSDYGVTLSLKNTMTYLGSATKYHSANKSWLHTVSLNPEIKSKQVLSFMDALVGNNRSGPGSSSTFKAYTIIVSKDIVAADYNALRLMEKQPSPNKNSITKGDSQLKAAESAGLGTCTFENMEVITIAPPWTTGTIGESHAVMQSMNVQVLNKGNIVEFFIPAAPSQHADITIYDMQGRVIWHAQGISNRSTVWNKNSQLGTIVPAGMYVYKIKVGREPIKGIVRI